jgi:hypothetical protein
MKIVCYHNGADHQKAAMARFVVGLLRHGIGHTMEALNTTIHDCDLAVIWGHRAHGIINRQKSKGAHYLVMERGYIGDRFQWTSLGFDGLNGRARFPQINDHYSRWNRYFDEFIYPWRAPRINRVATIMGQCRGDASLVGCNFEQWIQNINNSLVSAGFDVSFRPHPGDPNHLPQGVKKFPGSLGGALLCSELIVTYNSNSGVDAVLAGVPVFAQDPGSMVYELSSRDFIPITPERLSWCEKMSFTQWLPDEIESGDAWAALRTVIE